MGSVFRFRAYKVVVFSNDHGPAHVHVIGGGGHAKFALGRTPAEVRLLEGLSIPKRDLRRIAEEIISRHEACLDAWKSLHGNEDAD